ncbi:MAG: hypothetical protein AB7F43_09560 [Bacteriovoracia bacterium]
MKSKLVLVAILALLAGCKAPTLPGGDKDEQKAPLSSDSTRANSSAEKVTKNSVEDSVIEKNQNDDSSASKLNSDILPKTSKSIDDILANDEKGVDEDELRKWIDDQLEQGGDLDDGSAELPKKQDLPQESGRLADRRSLYNKEKAKYEAKLVEEEVRSYDRDIEDYYAAYERMAVEKNEDPDLMIKVDDLFFRDKKIFEKITKLKPIVFNALVMLQTSKYGSERVEIRKRAIEHFLLFFAKSPELAPILDEQRKLWRSDEMLARWVRNSLEVYVYLSGALLLYHMVPGEGIVPKITSVKNTAGALITSPVQTTRQYFGVARQKLSSLTDVKLYPSMLRSFSENISAQLWPGKTFFNHFMISAAVSGTLTAGSLLWKTYVRKLRVDPREQLDQVKAALLFEIGISFDQIIEELKALKDEPKISKKELFEKTRALFKELKIGIDELRYYSKEDAFNRKLEKATVNLEQVRSMVPEALGLFWHISLERLGFYAPSTLLNFSEKSHEFSEGSVVNILDEFFSLDYFTTQEDHDTGSENEEDLGEGDPEPESMFRG